MSIALSSRGDVEPGPQRVGGAAQDDPDAGDEQRDRECRGDRPERARVGGPEDGQHEDQPDVIGLPDRRHRMVGVLADALPVLAAPGEELPEAGTEVGAGEHA